MKSDYQYSAAIVYINYPWPESVSEKQRAAVEAAAQRILSIRAEFLMVGTRSTASPSFSKSKKVRDAVESVPTKTNTLADLYDPLATPPALQQAHEALDRAVDKCCRPEPFTSERQRVEYLFALYEKLTAPLVAPAKTKGVRRNKETDPPHPPAPPAPQHPGPNPDQAAADAAHFYSVKEEAPPYRTD